VVGQGAVAGVLHGELAHDLVQLRLSVAWVVRDQSTLDAVYIYVVPWSEFPIVPSYPH